MRIVAGMRSAVCLLEGGAIVLNEGNPRGALRLLAGEEPGPEQVRELLAGYTRGRGSLQDLPSWLRPHASEAKKRYWERWKRRFRPAPRPQKKAVWLLSEHLQRTLLRTLEGSTYREGESRWVECSTTYRASVTEYPESPVISGDPVTVWHDKHAWRATALVLQAMVSRRDYLALLRALAAPRGVSALKVDSTVHDKKGGRLVALSLSDFEAKLRPGELCVVLGRQGRGFEVATYAAAIAFDGEKWVLRRWL